MSKSPNNRWKRALRPCSNPWVPVSVFVIVLVYVAYLMEQGETANSAITITLGAALVACTVVSRLIVASAAGRATPR